MKATKLPTLIIHHKEKGWVRDVPENWFLSSNFWLDLMVGVEVFFFLWHCHIILYCMDTISYISLVLIWLDVWLLFCDFSPNFFVYLRIVVQKCLATVAVVLKGTKSIELSCSFSLLSWDQYTIIVLSLFLAENKTAYLFTERKISFCGAKQNI